MKRFIYIAAVMFTFIFGGESILLFTRLIGMQESPLMLFTVIMAMGLGVLASATGAVAMCTYMTPYEIAQWKEARAERAAERRK